MDRFLAKLPGSTPQKAAVVSFCLIAALGYPVFSKDNDANNKQGHNYLSQERPEFVASGQEKLRKLQSEKRDG